jgi:hypothetical protein
MMRTADFTGALGLVADRSRTGHRVRPPCFTTNTIAFRCAGETLGAMYGFRFIRVARAPGRRAGAGRRVPGQRRGLLVWVGPGNYTEGEEAQLLGHLRHDWTRPTTVGPADHPRDSTGSAAGHAIGDGNPLTSARHDQQRQLARFSASSRWWDAQVGGNELQPDQPAHVPVPAQRATWTRPASRRSSRSRSSTTSRCTPANSPTDYFVEDAGFVKLRELSVRYRLPTSFTGLSAPGARGRLSRSSAATCSRSPTTRATTRKSAARRRSTASTTRATARSPAASKSTF